MNSQQKSEFQDLNNKKLNQNEPITSITNDQSRCFELMKRPISIMSDSFDMITSPLLQDDQTITHTDDNHISFDEIQNLPTPIIATNRGGRPYFKVAGSISPTIRISSNAGPFTVSKVRNKNKHILTESNVEVQNKNSESYEVENNCIDVPKQRVNSSITSMLLMQNIRPIDRVVSLPLSSPNLKEYNNLNAPLTQIDNQEHTGATEAVIPLQLITYSIDELHRPQKWLVANKIGSGSFSNVYLEKNGTVALKVTDLVLSEDRIDVGELRLRIQNSFSREVEVLKTLSHPNIIYLIGTDCTQNENTDEIERMVMALEYCRGGDLFDFVLNKRDEMSLSLMQCIFSNIVSAVYYLHGKNICHRDIKPENILLKFTQWELLKDGVELHSKNIPLVVLSDFGLSKKIDPRNPMLSTRCGSEDYVSPELLLGMPYDGKQNDCWSLGVVLYVLLESRLPFDPLPTEINKLNSRKANPSHRIVMIMWSWYKVRDDPTGIFAEPKSIVKMLLCKRDKRATILDIANTEWIKNIH
ncbi:hypothetical protein CANINC_003750 [Pichia inconspicua]|uniref:non-specific serine/threonine protein kinase n=1 Tax=Pichia inconspicua TaxID=52247 RepID=A0A4T0WXP4_9ASCO|nr:hypothetical protein CANINC_003750 [[Candida] inconspicua]